MAELNARQSSFSGVGVSSWCYVYCKFSLLCGGFVRRQVSSEWCGFRDLVSHLQGFLPRFFDPLILRS